MSSYLPQHFQEKGSRSAGKRRNTYVNEDDSNAWGRAQGWIEVLKLLTACLMVCKHLAANELRAKDEFNFGKLFIVMAAYSACFTFIEVTAYRKNWIYLSMLMILDVLHMTALAALGKDDFTPYVVFPVLFFVQCGIFFVWSTFHTKYRISIKEPKRSKYWFMIQIALLIWIPGISVLLPFFQRDSRFRESSFEWLMCIISGLCPFTINVLPVLFASIFAVIHRKQQEQERILATLSFRSMPREQREKITREQREQERKDNDVRNNDDDDEEKQQRRVVSFARELEISEEKQNEINAHYLSPKFVSKLFGCIIIILMLAYSFVVAVTVVNEREENADMDRSYDLVASVLVLAGEVSMLVLIIFVIIYARLIFTYGGSSVFDMNTNDAFDARKHKRRRRRRKHGNNDEDGDDEEEEEDSDSSSGGYSPSSSSDDDDDDDKAATVVDTRGHRTVE